MLTTGYTIGERVPQPSFSMVGPNKKQLFAQAYEAYSNAVFKHCLFRLSDRQTAENLAQETFTRAWSYLKQGNEVGNLRALLYKIANNLIIDKYRAKKSLSLESLQASGVTFGGDEHNAISHRLAVYETMALLEKLDKKSREAITLRFIKGLSLAEIGKALGASENAIAVRIHRGLKRFRELL